MEGLDLKALFITELVFCVQKKKRKMFHHHYCSRLSEITSAWTNYPKEPVVSAVLRVVTEDDAGYGVWYLCLNSTKLPDKLLLLDAMHCVSTLTRSCE